MDEHTDGTEIRKSSRASPLDLLSITSHPSSPHGEWSACVLGLGEGGGDFVFYFYFVFTNPRYGPHGSPGHVVL